MKTIELICTQCSGIFTKSLGEYTRNVKNGQTNHFCSLSCSVAYSHSQNKYVYNTEYLMKGSITDEFSSFRYYTALIRQRKHAYDIDVEFIKELWDNQNGICPITGWKLTLPINTAGFVNKRHPVNASIDRIDSSKGYVKGNIRFVAYIVNIAKSTWDDKLLYKFCKDVVNYNK